MDFYLEIKSIIKDCEEVQQSKESDWTKEREKIFAYEHIKEIIYGVEGEKR